MMPTEAIIRRALPAAAGQETPLFRDGRRRLAWWAALALMAGVVLSFAQTTPAFAQQRHLGEFIDWISWVNGDGGDRICYVATSPRESSGNYEKRGNVFLLVARFAGKVGDREQVSVKAGYPYKENKPPVLTIEKRKFYLFSVGEEHAWSRHHEDDLKLIAAMRKGRRAVLQGVSKRGTSTKDIFSLIGFSAAWQAASSACP